MLKFSYIESETDHTWKANKIIVFWNEPAKDLTRLNGGFKGMDAD